MADRGDIVDVEQGFGVLSSMRSNHRHCGQHQRQLEDALEKRNKYYNDDDEGSSAYETCLGSPATSIPANMSPLSPPPERFYSASNTRCGQDDDHSGDEAEKARRYSGQLDTPERRNSFAERLRAALRRARSGSVSSRSSDSNYAVDISVTGSSLADPNIRMRRGGSRGFMLESDSLNSGGGGGGILIGKRRTRPAICGSEFLFGENSMAADGRAKDRNESCGDGGGGHTFTTNSSIYSFSTECSSSDLENVCHRLDRWLNERKEGGEGGNDDDDGYWRQQKLREDDAISQFARNLLKRALSESFVGVELTDGDRGLQDAFDDVAADADADDDAADDRSGRAATRDSRRFKNDLKLKMAARSLSLELVKRNPRLAARLANGGRYGHGHGHDEPDSSTTLVTGNWGCGSSSLGDAQLKLLMQWVAASAAGQSRILYYTCHHPKLLKLDTLRRILVDRRWSVGELVRAIVYYTRNTVAQLQQEATAKASGAVVVVVGQNESPAQDGDADADAEAEADHNQCISDHVTLFDLLISSDEDVAYIEAQV